jgi:hypothetical protein
MEVLKFITNHKRELLYGLVLGAGSISLQLIAKNYNYDIQLLVIVINLAMLLIGIYVHFSRADAQLKQLDLPSVDQLTPSLKLILHILFPAIFLITLEHFIIFNNYPWLSIIYFIITAFVTTSYLINIKAHYLDKFKLVEKTNYIYDVTRILVFFMVLDIILNISSILSMNIYLVGLIVFVISAALIASILIRKININYFDILLILLAGLALGLLLVGIHTLLAASAIIVSFFLTLCYYILAAVITHELDNTLRLSTVVEYLLVSLLALLVLFLVL